MKVKIVFDISEEDRRNINNYWSNTDRSVKASHADIKAFIQGQTSTLLESLYMDDDVQGDEE